MKPLLKVMLILGAIFTTTFVLGRVFGILTIENVRIWLEWAQQVDPTWVIALIVGLLFIDLFVAVPTLSLTILAGFFLGFPLGFASSFLGVSLAAMTGYWLSWRWGDRAIGLVVKDPLALRDLTATFHQAGPVMIVLSRAAPMVPEVTACIAGATRMPFHRFALFFAIGTLPYSAIASYAGSISSVESPQPAIFAALLLYGILWTGWFVFRRSQPKGNRGEAD